MKNIYVKIQKAHDDVDVPKYETEHASGVDVKAYLPDGDIIIKPGQTTLVPTGIKVEIPEGYEMQVRPRSGISLKTSLRIANSPGTVDSDYRGNVGIIMTNISDIIDHNETISNGMRIAQLVFCPVVQAEFLVVQELNETKRGEGGFGSTGTK